MSNISISWTPGGGSNVTGQQVQRKTPSTSFTTIATVGPTVNSYTDTTALDNVVYIYRVLSICTTGGPTAGNEDCAGGLVCPAGITATPSGNVVTFSLPALGDGVQYDVVRIYQGPNTSSPLVHTETLNINGPTTFNVTLLYSTSYFYQVVLEAPSCPEMGTLICGGNCTTGAQPTCPAPTNLTAVLTD